jgi:uncharacterized protein
MSATEIQPIASGKRTAIVDMLRGWALLGVALMNYTDYSFFDRTGKSPKPDTLTTVLQIFGNIVFSAKSWTMLSMLFGYGFAVLIRNVANKGYNPVKFFTIRMFWLFVIAFINCCFWWGDILKDYAFMGLILLFFYKIKPKPAFILCLILFSLIPAVQPLVKNIKSNSDVQFNKLIPLYHSSSFINNVKFHLLGTWYREVISPGYLYTVHLVMFACFLLGYAAQRINFFENIAENKKHVKRILWYMLSAVLLLVAFFITADKLKWTYYKYYNPGYIFIIATMLLITSALCLLYVNGKLKAFFRSMENIGKMTLTNYLVQNVISFFVFGGVGLGLGSKMPYWFYLALPFAIYIIQVYFSKWWLSQYNYGPVEWLWRMLSYHKILPIKKERGVKVVG